MGNYPPLHRLPGLTDKEKWAYIKSCRRVTLFSGVCVALGGVILVALVLVLIIVEHS